MRSAIVVVLLCTFFSGVLSAQDDSKFQSRYLRSNLYSSGEYEIHLFNNYYTQKDKLRGSDHFNSRYDFFTSTAQFLYGVNTKLNVGFALNFRSVFQNLNDDSGIFNALKFKNDGFLFDSGQTTGYSRTGFSMAGPRIQYQVFPRSGSFSILHTLMIPLGKNLGGNSETGYLDWGSPVLMNQLFFDKNIGTRWSVFAELGFFIENMNKAMFSKQDGFYQFSIPTTAILSYFPFTKGTVYGLLSYSGRWENSVSNSVVNTNFNPWYQLGLGFKYWISSKIEVEVILTAFEDELDTRTASTFNLGFRYFSNR